MDAVNGSDDNEGTLSAPWQSLEAISELEFEPGDSIFLKRGKTEYDGCVNLTGDGTESQPITLGVYGEGEAPRLTNSDSDLCSGNVIQVRGDYHIIEDLYIHHSQPAEANVASFEDVWERGAVHVGLGHDHVIIQRNEFANTPKAIQSYSEYSLITGNTFTTPMMTNKMVSCRSHTGDRLGFNWALEIKRYPTTPLKIWSWKVVNTVQMGVHLKSMMVDITKTTSTFTTTPRTTTWDLSKLATGMILPLCRRTTS